ncbi:MAG: hypothetical protein VX257_08125, partial [Planctomycetota bacterium]|nr:hypothetical protein [Planctomycetota bacterium]
MDRSHDKNLRWTFFVTMGVLFGLFLLLPLAWQRTAQTDELRLVVAADSVDTDSKNVELIADKSQPVARKKPKQRTEPTKKPQISTAEAADVPD